jgi:putative ABC transport system permease protein
VVPLSEAVIAPQIRRVLFLLFGAVALVLALACANVTNLSLARMTMRSREVAIRSALGAARFRIVRQLLTESVVLSLAGGAIGLALAWWGTNRLMQLAAPHLPRATDVGIDWRVFAFLFVTCAVTGAVMGIAPALIASRRDARAVLQESGTQTTSSRTQRWLRDGLVIAEVAVALVLAIGAAVLIRELIRLRHTDSGMETRNAITFHLGHRMIARGREGPYPEDIRQFYEIEDRVARLPGVRAAGFTQLLPLQNWGWTSSTRDFRIRGEAPQSVEFPIQLRFVTPGYFRAQGTPIVKGRGFTAADTRDAPMVIVINETLARRFFGDRDPVGAETTRGIIAGVVRDVRQVHLDRPAEPEVYYAVAQNWSQISDLGMTLVVSTQDRPEPLIDSIRSIVREVNPNLAIFNIKTMERVVADSLSDFTLYLSLIACFAALALVLAVSGAYGVISCVAMSRMREFAIRMALGADRGRVMQLVVARGVALALAGVGVGTLAAYVAAPLLRGLPVSVRPPDAVTIVPLAVALGLIATAASVVPARRASRVDPMAVLRKD